MSAPTVQLQLVLDVPAPSVAVAALIRAVVDEIDYLSARPDPEDDVNRACRDRMVHGYSVLLAWLDGLAELPADWSTWPCSTCLAAPGVPCDIPNRYRSDRSLSADRDQLHHLDRGIDGRWACRIPAGAAT